VDLAQLPDSVIKKAREGTQHYTLSDLLHSRSPDMTSSSALADEQTLVLKPAADGTLTTLSGADVTLARTQSSRKRNIAGMSEITEVFLFTLIAVVYADRPDICEQLLMLLALAHDIDRVYGWRVALTYIEGVRRSFYSLCVTSSNSAPKHVTEIVVTWSMATLRQPLLDAAIASSRATTRQQQGSGTGRVDQSATSRRAGKASSSPTPSGTCNDWNRGNCRRTECRFLHECSSCSSSDHPAAECTPAAAAPVTNSSAAVKVEKKKKGGG
jgi:hypothetical protein